MSCTSGLDSPPLAYSCDAPCLLGPTLPLRLTASSSSPRPWQRATPLEEASPCLNPPPRVPNSPHGPADGSKGRLFVSLDNFSIKQESAALQKSSSGAFTQIATSLGPFQLEGAMCIEHADSRSDNIDGINTAWGLSNAFCERSRPTPIMTDASKRYDDSDRQLSDPKTYSRLSVGPTDPIHSREKATSRCALEKPILTAALSKVSITPVKMSRAATSPAENAGIFRVPLTSDGLPTSESRAATGDLSHPKDYAKLAPVTSVRPSVTSCSDVMLSSRRRHGGESLVHTITMATENNIRPSVPSSGTASLQFPESNSPPPGRADLSPTHCPSIPTVLHRHHFLKQPPAPSVDGRMDARRTAKTNCSDGTRYQRTEDTVLPDPPAVAMVAHRDTTYHIDGQTSPSNQASLLSTAMVTSSASISPSSLACLYPSGDLSDSLTGLEAANTSDIVNWIDAFEKSLLGQQLVQNDVLASCDALTQSQRLDLTMHYIKPEHSQHSTQCVQSTSEEVELMFTTLEPKSNQLKYDERGINQTSEQEFPVDKVVEDSFNSDHWFQLEDLLDPLDPAFLNFLDENDQFGINLSARSDHNSLDSYEQVDPNQNPGPFDNDFQQEGMLSDSEDTSDVNSSCTNSLQTNPLHIQPFQSPNDRLVESESEGHQATPPSVSRRDREKKLFQAGRDFIKSVQGANQSSLSHHQLRKQKAQTLRMLRQQPMKMTSNSAVKDMVIFSVDSPTFSVSLDASRSPTYSLSGLDHGTCVEKTMERRLRNNEASRRSRAAKKSRFAAMEREAEQLAWQNQRLRIRLKQLNLAAAEAKELLVGKVSLLSTSNGTVKSEA